MTKFYNPRPVQQSPIVKNYDAKSLVTTFVTIANMGVLNSNIPEQQKLRADLDKQLQGIYKQAVEDKKRREAAQLPTHTKQEVRHVSVHSRRSNYR